MAGGEGVNDAVASRGLAPAVLSRMNSTTKTAGLAWPPAAAPAMNSRMK